MILRVYASEPAWILGCKTFDTDSRVLPEKHTPLVALTRTQGNTRTKEEQHIKVNAPIYIRVSKKVYICVSKVDS